MLPTSCVYLSGISAEVERRCEGVKALSLQTTSPDGRKGRRVKKWPGRYQKRLGWRVSWGGIG